VSSEQISLHQVRLLNDALYISKLKGRELNSEQQTAYKASTLML
jgi:hypothetical protein